MTSAPAESACYVGVDVGGSSIKAGVVDANGRALSHDSVATEARRGPRAGVETIAAVIEKTIAESGVPRSSVRSVGLATPGTMDIEAGRLLRPGNLPGWTDFPIRDLVAERIQLPTLLQNDANAAAYGEYWVGAARGVHSLVFWTLGTGIGCGIIVHGQVIDGAHSHGAECGHIIVEMDGGRHCPGTGQYGTLEAYAGGWAVVERCREALLAGRASVLRSTVAAGNELTPLAIHEAAEQGDVLALELVRETARCLAVGTTTLLHTIDPEIVLLGGAMTFGGAGAPAGRRFLAEVRAEVCRRTFPVLAERTRIEFASLGNDAGYIGAAGCARLRLP